MQELLWAHNKAPDFPSDQDQAIVILPIGSTEQHGPHLPVDVDTRLASQVALRAAKIVARQKSVYVLPPLWISMAEHHMNFGGTLSLDFTSFAAVLRCIVRSISRHNLRRILILNGHGGNIPALNVIIAELSQELRLPLAFTTYWEAAQVEFSEILETQDNLLHACEAETSMMMALSPELVDVDKAQSINAPLGGFSPVNGVSQWRPIDEWARSGVVGVPTAATSEKGERLLEAAAGAVAARLLDGSIWER